MLNTPNTAHDTNPVEPVIGKAQPARARGRALSVVIPCFNEEKGIEALIAHLRPILEATALDWDVVFIDDGSRDRTRELLYKAHTTDPRFTAVCFSRNFGKEIAVAAGLGYAKGDAVIIMDADLQHPPELIHTFIAKWREGYDIVYGQREDRDADSPVRRFFSRGFYRMFEQMSGTTLPDGAGDFRLMDRQAVDAMNRMSERARFNKGLYAWIGFKSTGVKFVVPPRFDGGGSRWRPRQLWRFALDGLMSFSTVPLRIWSYMGLFVSGLAFGYVLFFLIKTLVFGADVPGFPTLIISVLFLGGMQLISLGVIGEYLGRIYEEVKNRPLYLVSEEIGVTRPPQNRRSSDRLGA
ncbi:MAG: glycosyltransferase family 2 protein [Hyphomicrobiaceae bacterium]|nr:glycosyltransferase family 2 protein [Hyphomicrobiaceae bacterium]